MADLTRCAWAKPTSEAYIKYHDEEWGVPVTDDRKLFEFLTLEGAQAGLSWSTILAKREAYRESFHQFEVPVVAAMNESELAHLLEHSGIVRNRLKVHSTVNNAQCFIRVQEEFGSFCQYVWSFTDHSVIHNQWESSADVPATTPQSDTLSKDLKKRGFKFVGSTIMYAFMQAVGMVNDHTVQCFRYQELKSGQFPGCPSK